MVKNVFNPGTVAKSSEVNENFEYVEALAAKGMAQVPYTTLKAVGDWENEGNLAADRFTTSDGVKSTYGGGTALFSVDKYILTISETPFTLVGTDNTGSGFQNISNLFDNDTHTFGQSASLNTGSSDPVQDKGFAGKTFDERFISFIEVTSFVEQLNTVTSGTGQAILILQTFDGSTWTNHTTLFDISYSHSQGIKRAKTTQVVFINDNVQGIRCFCRGRSLGWNSDVRIRVNMLNENTFASEDTVISDQNTLTLNGDEKLISLYNQATLPTNTSMKCTLNDGVQDISAQTTLSENDTTLIPITTTPTAGNTLELHYTLETTDNTVTPELYGYGVYKN